MVCSSANNRRLGGCMLAGLLLPGLVGCGNEPGNGVQPIFPADYRSTFTLVRDCRNSSAHPSTIRVYVNDIGAEGYDTDADPLPQGTLVVKEEFGGPSCDNDNDLLSWTAMLKREAGFDPDDGDWQWQRVTADRTVLTNDKSTCISCHAQAECLARDHMCTLP